MLSLFASIVLFFQGNYYHMYKWSNIVCCGSPIVHPQIYLSNRANIDNQKNRIDAKMNKMYDEMERRLPYFFKQKIVRVPKNARKANNQTWTISPFHNALTNRNYVLFCVLSLLGGSFEAENKEGKSVLEELLEMLDNDRKNFNEMNVFVKWWILKQTEHH
jgi:hypothetical protein